MGRLSHEKGFDIAVDAAKLLKDRGMTFEWHILGGGAERENLEQQIGANGLQEYVYLEGVQSNPYAYMANADLLVQPSRIEGRSIVLDEAKMTGIPIIATRYRTATDQLQDGVDGVIVDMTPEALARGIQQLMDDEPLRSRIREYQLAHNYDNIS